jgi:hypothetical protein
MAMYVDRDIESNFSGDLGLDTKGDLGLADSLETHKAAANFVLRTDFGEYQPDGSVGANLGSFIGLRNVQETHELMEYNVNKALKEEIFSETDVLSQVVPFDIHEALCVVSLAGLFFIDGEFTSVEDDRIAYTFPYIEGSPSPINVNG